MPPISGSTGARLVALTLHPLMPELDPTAQCCTAGVCCVLDVGSCCRENLKGLEATVRLMEARLEEREGVELVGVVGPGG